MVLSYEKFIKMYPQFPLQHGIFHLLEHIFKKMGSTEIVVSSVRPSVRLSVCLSVRLSPISQPL
jgi:hypothetical protein